jgi:hypothetical protein
MAAAQPTSSNTIHILKLICQRLLSTLQIYFERNSNRKLRAKPQRDKGLLVDILKYYY